MSGDPQDTGGSETAIKWLEHEIHKLKRMYKTGVGAVAFVPARVEMLSDHVAAHKTQADRITYLETALEGAAKGFDKIGGQASRLSSRGLAAARLANAARAAIEGED